MSQTPVFHPPAGWYPDANAPGSERWWTGAAWSEYVQATPIPYQSGPAPSSYRPLQMSITSLAFGIVSLALNPFLLASIVAWARGAQGLKRAKLSVLEGYGPRGKAMSIWGIALGGAGIPMGALQTWGVISAWAMIL